MIFKCFYQPICEKLIVISKGNNFYKALTRTVQMRKGLSYILSAGMLASTAGCGMFGGKSEIAHQYTFDTDVKTRRIEVRYESKQAENDIQVGLVYRHGLDEDKSAPITDVESDKFFTEHFVRANTDGKLYISEKDAENFRTESFKSYQEKRLSQKEFRSMNSRSSEVIRDR